MSAKSLLKFKSNRALGQNIWPTRKITPKQKLILLKIKTKKPSNFGLQLRSKRFLSILYGNLSKSQMQKTFEEASKIQGKIGNNFISYLEKRLDTLIFRMNVCRTFRAGRQLIIHQKVFVNNKLIDIPSYQLSPGDIISISSENSTNFRSASSQFLQNLHANSLCQTKSLHLEINYKSLTAIFLYPPQQLIYPSEFDIPVFRK